MKLLNTMSKLTQRVCNWLSLRRGLRDAKKGRTRKITDLDKFLDEWRKPYIKMCDCPEVQERWEPGRWSEIYCPVYNCQIGCGKHENIYLGSSPLPESAGNFLYLPRQEDIQGWLREAFDCSDWFLVVGWHDFNQTVYPGSIGFNNFYEDLGVDVGLEEAWLRFYMHEIHNKHWTEEGWK